MQALSLLRLPLALVIATGVTLGLFWFMFRLISTDAQLAENNSQAIMVEFVRLQRDTETRKKQRQKKPPPKVKKPSIPKVSSIIQDAPSAEVLNINVPNVQTDVSISAGQSFLSGAKVGMGFGDSDVLPLVKARPVYPQVAQSRGISGSVTARLFINERGTVDKVEILEAKPAGVFNRESIRAFYRYKFKPKLIDGKPAPQTVTQRMKFNLGEQ